MTQSADVVVVGGGIAGSALATALAMGGLEVVVLERQSAYRDKVRG
ncbi:MAG: FAD-dependent oxidoreductase, partial [Actinomycetota bacterium]|nr:FAD-dependent oxidoreductase [Actinomycetota bacterium]